MVIGLATRDLVAGIRQPLADRRLVLGEPAPEPLLEGREAGGGHEDQDGRREAVGDLHSPLDVDLEDHAFAAGQGVPDRLDRGPVQVAVDLGRFEQLAPIPHLLEFMQVDEVVLAPVLLPGAGRPGRRRDREPGLDLRASDDGPDHRGLARPGRAGDDDQAA